MAFFQMVLDETKLYKEKLEALPVVQDMLSGNYRTERYIKLLRDLYPIVANFCPVMAAAASRCGVKDTMLQDYLYEHILEEKRHEEIVLRDLSYFDISSKDVINAPLSFPVQAMIAYNYHMVDRSKIFTVLGMIYVLEVISMQYGGKVASGVAKNMNRLPEQGFSFLLSHSEMDADHMVKLQQILTFVVDPDDQQALMHAIKMNFYFISQIILN